MAFLLPNVAATLTYSYILYVSSATLKGISNATWFPSLILRLLTFFSSSVSFGSLNADIRTKKASVSLFIRSKKLSLSTRHCSKFLSTSILSSLLYSLYAFLPTVKLNTIAPNAVAKDAPSAATLPPPGAGEFEPNSLINSLTVF